MQFYSSIVTFFRDGGVFLYPLAVIFAFGIAIAIERWLVLTRASISNRVVWDKITPNVKAGKFDEALRIAEQSKTGIGTVLAYGLSRVRVTHRRDDIEKAMEESLLEIIPKLEKRTHFLSSLANIGMLIGLLGTVVGLISAFSAISTANPADKASLLAASISVAMNNTASGLIVAITLLLSHMVLEAKTTSLIDSLEIAALKFLNSISERTSAGGAMPPAPAAPTPPRGPLPARGTA